MAAVFGALGSLLTPSKEQEPSKMSVANDAIENGEAGTERVNETPVSVISSAEEQSLSQDNAEKCPDVNENAKNAKLQQKGDVLAGLDAPISTGDECGMCHKSITIRQASGCAKCGFCDSIFCKDCSHFTPQMCKNVLERADVLWACYSCLPRLENAKLATPVESSTDTIDKGKSTTPNFEELKGEINSVITEKVVPQLISKIEQSMNTLSENIKQWNCISYANAADGNLSDSETADSDDEEFPDALTKVLSKKEQKALRRAQREENTSLKLVQAALASQKDDEERQRNLIIYRIPESLASVTEARTKDREAIQRLLETLDVDSSPVEIRRLGRFDKDIVKDRPRPVKVMLTDRSTRDLAMANVAKLARATDPTIKSLQVCYDLNKDQRVRQKSLVAEGKELSKNSQTHIWKVRGPPENMLLRKFIKRNTTPAHISPTQNNQAQTSAETTQIP